ncbi:MAG: hypothetical protein E6G02_13760 [Actinobacteria bacterium]|nr:MAG: hypothetical protein E6G02_13760 [Actinomycetota bacterium]
MPILEVVPRPTPAERYNAAVAVMVEEALAVHAATIEDWVTPRQAWELTLREGTEFDRPNNVEGMLLFVIGEQTSSLTFRLDQLDRVEDEGQELILIFEERDGIAKAARLTANGLDVELFHILTFT